MTRYRFDQIAENSTAKKKPEDSDRERYVGLEHLDPGTLKVTRWGAEVTPKGDKLLMERGDVLFGRRRAYQKKVGIAPFDGIFSAHGMVLRPRTDVVDPDFFPFFISSDAFLDEAIRVSVGSLSPTANWKDLKVLEFGLPTLDKQRELAGILSEAEQLKGCYRSLLATCDDIVKSQFVEMFGDPRTQTKGLSKLGDHVQIVNGFAFKGEFFCDSGIPVIKIANVNSSTFAQGSMKFYEYDASLERFTVSPGDLLISLTGTVGKDDFAFPCIVDNSYEKYYLNQRNAKLIPFSDLVPTYLLHLLKNEFIHERLVRSGTGVRQCHLHNANIEAVSFKLPPRELQQEFADFAVSVDKSKFAVQKALDELNATTKKILNQELGLGDV